MHASTGLLTKVRYGGLYDVDYTYDGNGRVVKMTDCIDGTDGVRFAFDHAGTLTANMDNDTWPLNEATPQMATPTGRVLADIAGTEPATGTARYYYHDNIDSTRRIRAANKTSLRQYEFDPYGLTYASSGAQSPYRWGPYRQDPSNSMYYTPYRWYIPMQARWLSRDPLGMADGPNVYAYVHGSPVGANDSLGLYTQCECLAKRKLPGESYADCLWRRADCCMGGRGTAACYVAVQTCAIKPNPLSCLLAAGCAVFETFCS